MSLFIESICLINGKLRNLDLHQARFNRTRAIHFPNAERLNLNSIIQIPENLTEEKYKVRVVYGLNIELIEFLPYEQKKINSIKLFNIDSEINYSYKSTDRSLFLDLIKKVNCDDLILVQDGKITDATYSNLIFFNGIEWHTPTTYLLPGVMRQHLLNERVINEKDIRISELDQYISFKRINAMMDFDEAETFDIERLKITL